MQAHYFNQASQNNHHYFRIQGKIGNHDFSLFSAKGLFSANRFDLGTRIVLKYFQFGPEPEQSLLDLGSGYGLVASYLADQFVSGRLTNLQSLHIDACDSSELAVHLTQVNIEHYHSAYFSSKVLQSAVLDNPYFDDRMYQSIITNPPFSAGKQTVYQFFQQGYQHLAPHGKMRIVVPSKKGAKSYLQYCKEQFGSEQISIIALEAGYRVWTLHKY